MDISNLPNIPKALDKLLPSIYEDVLQAPAKEVGLALKKVVEISLSPVSLTYGAYEIVNSFFIGVQRKLLERAGDLGENFSLKCPKERFSKVLIRNVIESGAEENIRELFENLLVNEMFSTDQGSTHPDFANVIGRMSSEEAKLFLYIGKRQAICEKIDLKKRSIEWHIKNVMHFTHLHIIGLLEDTRNTSNLELTGFGMSLFFAVLDTPYYKRVLQRSDRFKQYLANKDKGESE